MTAVRQLICATDFSAGAQRAVQRAAMLAHELRVPLTLWHGLTVDTGAALWTRLSRSDDLAQRLRAQAQTILANLAEALSEQVGAAVDWQLREGSLPQSLLADLGNAAGCLLVLGAQGEGRGDGVARLLLGSTADRVLRAVRVPVLVARDPLLRPYSRVLVGVDAAHSGTALAGYAACIAPGSTLTLLHTVVLPYEGKLKQAGVDEAHIGAWRQQARAEAWAVLEEVARGAEPAPQRWQPLVVEGDSGGQLLESETQLSADLVVVGRHAQGLVQDWLLGSTTQRVLAHGRSDVLVVPV